MLQVWYNKQVVFLLFLRPGMEPFVEGCIEHQRFHESSSEASASGPEFMSCRISSINGMGVS